MKDYLKADLQVADFQPKHGFYHDKAVFLITPEQWQEISFGFKYILTAEVRENQQQLRFQQ